MSESKAQIMATVVQSLEQWLEERRQSRGGECSQSEWTNFNVMMKRIGQWNRELLTRYRAYLQNLPAGGDIKLTRPQVYETEGGGVA